ncbi:o-succinylbenzoate--CoA ligase [Salinibaculum rarum]|uniref:o-succinylbenzoate--CoA ligase n=1 Tax=Salinibaculum rarum TaxID=3058903 RepID=UPI00265E35AB|nr:o-succinylbenzoate--CoA ligase [Salinibaculum sp. KK48]
MGEPIEWPTSDVLSHRTAATPDRTGVVDVATDREWTYREFDSVVSGLAARLERLVEMDSDSQRRVGLLASTRPEIFSTLFACWRLGYTVVPLDTQLTSNELATRLDRIDPALLVCEGGTEETALTTATCPVVSLDTPADERVESLQPRKPNGGEPEEIARWHRGDTAVVMFTSGTTGQPKGVRLTLGNLVASATGSAFRLGVSRGDRWLDCLPAYHMGGLAPAVRCSLYGTTLVVQQTFEADRVADTLASYGVTVVSLVPTQLKRLLDNDWTPAEPLETVLLGGAPASTDLLDRALEAGVPVYPTYGMTETASQVTTATPADAAAYPGTVGQPLVTTTVTVVAGDGTRVEAGETGELVVDGPTVTPGYLDDATTERAFGEFGLHTGDVGYRDEDGRLWVLGRADDTIITGGENVHPSEVESVLCDHPAVTDAAVVGLADEEWGERIGALVVADEVTTTDIESFARERLADYKVPKTLSLTSALPRTASGTVDRDSVRTRLE